MQGRFIVVEGVDGSGKTTIIKQAISINNGKLLYGQSFTYGSRWDSFIHAHPSSLFYYLDIAVKTATDIRPKLMEGSTIIQDRYVQSVDSFLPDCKWLHNKAIRKALNPLFLRPDLYIHLAAGLDEIIARLSNDSSTYHETLISNPERIIGREKKYMEIFEGLDCHKQVINTGFREPKDCAEELIDAIRRYTGC
ncbi:MAG: hypothetical protein ABIB71_08055 [Candidatus Woesearchaeota archaeon]